MKIQTLAERALEEIDWEEHDDRFGGTRYVSVPCQLRFKSAPERDVEQLHDALKTRGYTSADSDPARQWGGEGIQYEGEFCSQEHSNRIKVLAFRNGILRLYPKDGHVPTEHELAQFISGLEAGFNAGLEHDPIDYGDFE